MKTNHSNSRNYNGTYLSGFFRVIFPIVTLISIGFLMNTCSQSAKHSEMELNIVGRIGEDISLYRFHLSYSQERMAEVISAAEYLLEAIRNPEIQLSDQEIEISLNKLTWLWLAATPTTEYVALMNTGELALISSEELRRKFKLLNVDQERLKQFEELQVSYVNQELRPFLNKHVDRTTIDMNFKRGELITDHFPSPFESSPADLLKNREFANILTDVLFFTRRINLPSRRIEIVMNEMEEIIAKDYPEAEHEAFKPF
jgi:hypothetical protein